MRISSSVVLSIVLGASAHCSSVAQPTRDEQQLFAQLRNVKTTDAAYVHLKAIARSNPSVRQYLVTNLPASIPDDLSQSLIWSNSVGANSVRLAGDLRIAEAVPILMKSLDNNLAKPGGFATFAIVAELNNDPVAKALSQIGEPALRPVSDRLKNNSNSQKERVRAVEILNYMDSAGADQALVEQLKSENDPVVKATIVAVLQKHQK
jgi:hypothetical protein